MASKPGFLSYICCGLSASLGVVLLKVTARHSTQTGQKCSHHLSRNSLNRYSPFLRAPSCSNIISTLVSVPNILQHMITKIEPALENLHILLQRRCKGLSIRNWFPGFWLLRRCVWQMNYTWACTGRYNKQKLTWLTFIKLLCRYRVTQNANQMSDFKKCNDCGQSYEKPCSSAKLQLNSTVYIFFTFTY